MKENEIKDLKAELFDLQMQLALIQNEIRLKVLKLNQLLNEQQSDNKPVS